MGDKVLVAFGTKYGATAEIAEKIAEVLRGGGLSVDVENVKKVSGLSGYKAVILGSAVYMGFWRKEMAKFIEKNSADLAGKKVWLFASGTTGEADPVEEMGDRLYPPRLKPALDEIQPVDITAFRGLIDEGKLTGFDRWVINKVNAPTGDYRDWDRISAWAKDILKTL